MSDSLATLEERRSRIIFEIAQLGDFRPGSVHAQFRRCGKSNCACAHDLKARHGPLMRLSRKIDGKTVQDTLSDPAQVRKAQREVDGFRRFQALSAELLQVNERICQLRPVQAQDREQPAVGLKKNAAGDPRRRQRRGRATPQRHQPGPAKERWLGPRSLGAGHPRSLSTAAAL